MLTLEKRDQMTKKTTKEMDLQDQFEKVCPFAEGLSLESHLSSPETCICKNESLDMSQGTWYTVDEYLCVDDHEKVAFIEHKIKPIQKLIDCNETTQYSIESVNSSLSETTLKSLKDINDDDLLKQLRRFGEHPGPITDSTRRVYLRCLHKLRKKSQSESPKISTKLTSSSSSMKIFFFERMRMRKEKLIFCFLKYFFHFISSLF